MGGSGGLLGQVTDFVGLTDYAGAEARQEQATAAIESGTTASVEIAKQNIEFQTKQLEYQQAQYEDWKAVYGDLSENLGEYYKNLTGSKYATAGLTAEAQEFQRSKQDITRELAQRGISGGGMEAAAITAMGASSAAQRANIRATAEDTVRAQQQGFLGLGLGQGAAYLGIQAQQAGTVGNAYNTAASSTLQGAIAQGNIQSAYAQGTQSGSYGLMGSIVGAAGRIGAAAM